MNTLVIVLIAAVVLVAAYALYGRWLAKTWGIDPKAQTPAVKYNDGKDFVPTNGWTVFSHQFSSIAGAGPVTGAIQAAAFGWPGAKRKAPPLLRIFHNENPSQRRRPISRRYPPQISTSALPLCLPENRPLDRCPNGSESVPC